MADEADEIIEDYEAEYEKNSFDATWSMHAEIMKPHMKLMGTPQTGRRVITWNKKQVAKAKQENVTAFSARGCNQFEPIVWLKTRSPNPFDSHVIDAKTKHQKTLKNLMDFLFDESAIEYQFFKSGRVRMRIPCKFETGLRELG